MPPKEDRKGRQAFGHHDGNRSRASSATPQTPKGTPATPRQAESATPRPASAKKKKHADADHNNKENHNPAGVSNAQFKKLVWMVMQEIKASNSTELKSDNKVADAMNKVDEFKSEKMADRKWSNYPFMLPGMIDAVQVEAVRSKLSTINNKTVLSYCSDELNGANSFELGRLHCYDGVSEGLESNFLSCDFANPEYLDELLLGKERSENLQIKKAIPQWLSNKSCFVYAPVGTILSQLNTQPIPLSFAKSNWDNYAYGTGMPVTKSPGSEVPDDNILSQFWLYTEEFVDYVNKDKNPVHKTYKSVHNKGRIGMLFPIQPIKNEDLKELKLNYLSVGLDHVGWGLVTPIGEDAEKLESDFKPQTWHDLQTKIGRYILLTNIWSSVDSDPYVSEVDPKVLQEIYDRVYAMTSGKMYVNVRRGSTAYGRLCVVQKKIELNPLEEKFGLEASDQNKKRDLYATQIFTCGKRLTSGNEFQRMEFTPAHVWLKNNNLSDEEKNVVAIFQASNNKAIDCMKDQAYRQVMVDFWNKNDKDGNTQTCELMPTGVKDWRMSSMHALLVTMLMTASNVLFQRLPCKVACYERYHRFLEMTKHYRYWFVNSKCMADEDFVLKYEKEQMKAAADASRFSGLLPEMRGGAESSTVVNKTKHVRPSFGKYKASSTSRVSTNASSGASVTLAKNLRTLENDQEAGMLAKTQKYYEIMKQKFKEPVSKAEYDKFIEDVNSPTAARVARDYVEEFCTQQAHWGQDEDSFTARLAKLQDL